MPPPNPFVQNINDLWRLGDERSPVKNTSASIYRPEILDTIEQVITSLDDDLRRLNLDIHEHPELRFEEHRTHDVLTDFMMKQGFSVTPHHLLETAWVATFTHGSGGRNIGVNSEMDALPGIGHACGHNLIAMAGVAVACAVKTAMQKHDISGTVVLLGTPAEEGGGGKAILIDRGAYEGMDVCLMCHPAPGPPHSASLNSCLARQTIEVEFFGHTAHAALSPWEGQNALDAAVLAYTNISVLRQQLKPSHRVHGIFEGKDWTPNIIPDYAKMTWYVRAPTRAEMMATVKRVMACFQAAALATGCKIEPHLKGAVLDLRQNEALEDEFGAIFENRYGPVDYAYGIGSASTDFGNVTYALPSLHPGYGIPTEKDGGNHTPAFTSAAKTIEAHNATLDVSKTLAAIGVRILADDQFFAKVRKTFEKDCQLRDEEARQVDST
ncbi:hypothetical protein CERSUDRAFT_114992 [Gelatoporia subvermispora B]|uniref:Peptidase M20 domain-containing protein 2 n=1 Tax=Ceriporiopsis subvermispora (strain B) TaxID=914234 RepID=M2QY61_CERS8|nr:hypothetical protein CERSUDRAFT_114992 [Gelatoporia subvermispora B]